jgi:anti-sigma factor RsiW
MAHVQDRIPALLAGEMDAAATAAVTAHLAECPDCARDVAAARRVWALLGVVSVPPGAADSNAWPAVRARTFARQVRGPGPWRQAGLAGVALAAGLGLAVLLPGAGDRQAATGAGPDLEAASDVGGSFWLEESAGTSISDMWLTVAAGGNGS